MTAWTRDQLKRIGNAEELQLATAGADGKLTAYTTMWVVRVGDEIYVRSAGGPARPWYLRAKASRAGHIRAGNVQCDVAFGEADPEVHGAIDAAYHAKYDRYGPTIVGHVVGPAAKAVTVRLTPRSATTALTREER